MIKHTITAALVALSLGAALPAARAMPVGAALSISAAAAQPSIEQAKVVIRKTTTIRRPGKTIIKKVIIRRS